MISLPNAFARHKNPILVKILFVWPAIDPTTGILQSKFVLHARIIITMIMSLLNVKTAMKDSSMMLRHSNVFVPHLILILIKMVLVLVAIILKFGTIRLINVIAV